MYKHKKFFLLSTVSLILTLALTSNASDKKKVTLEESMNWLKDKVSSNGNFSGSCTGEAKLEGSLAITSIEGCKITFEATVAKKMGGFNQVKIFTVDMKTIEPSKILLSQNVIENCTYDGEPYYVNLVSKNGKDIEVRLKDYAKNTQKTYDSSAEAIFFNNQDIAERSAKALKYVVKLCNDTEPF